MTLDKLNPKNYLVRRQKLINFWGSIEVFLQLPLSYYVDPIEQDLEELDRLNKLSISFNSSPTFKTKQKGRKKKEREKVPF